MELICYTDFWPHRPLIRQRKYAQHQGRIEKLPQRLVLAHRGAHSRKRRPRARKVPLDLPARERLDRNGTRESQPLRERRVVRLGRVKRAESPAKHCLINQSVRRSKTTGFPDNRRVPAYLYNFHHECALTGNFRLHYDDFGRFLRIYQDEFVKIHPRKVFRGAKFTNF
jgi:hypothetical protein